MKHVNLFLYTSMLFITIALDYMAFLAFYPFKTIELEQPYTILNEEVRAGDIVEYMLIYCRYTNADVSIHHQIRSDTALLPLTSLPVRLREGCGETIKSVSIPKHAPKGTYILEETVTYHVNPFQDITLHFFSYPFEIIE